ncbi:MAG: Glyceraldehyde-3-phosphate dehydrogenase [Candidatus Yanofskybacteria bacterium GW2011_GWD2_39_48]|uniref:Glyceraldehyde-3-phosphate dehydrogenase n=1 Tax=Candidatus Yanofskybacteria bacterium GW2011_GWD2_39_48 TaxID=1619031 RepID=A0A0G0RMG8_9BACT|nr:MAG: Glyceraldehyde-3-phosphate dehydrogenase [Candidatus Yanofskybacteria bacterium GW2011_GWD2_39_48]
MAKIAINGFGRIGRAFLKLAIERPELEIVAINDLGDLENLAYLLRFDSVYGRYDKKVKVENGKLVIDDKEIVFLQEKDATKLPWDRLGVDIVIEATGVFESYEKASTHKQAGAKRVVLTAPAKDEDTEDNKTVLMGVNEENIKSCSISSNASCTTNSVAPVIQILVDKLGVKKAFLSTTHAMTTTQLLADGPTKGSDLRRGRAASVNIAPSTTGAAIAVTRAVKSLENKFDGMSLRVPVIDGSISVITFVSERPTTVEEINNILKQAEGEPRWLGIFRTTTEQIVSTDIIGEPCAALADLSLTKVVDGDLCTVFSWYDNEFGYTNTLVRHVLEIAKLF